jgi:hypothetical protein
MSLSRCESFIDRSHRLRCTQAQCSPVHHDTSYHAIAHYIIAWGSTTLPILSAVQGMRCYEKSIYVSTSLSGVGPLPRIGLEVMVSLYVVDAEDSRDEKGDTKRRKYCPDSG